ncbi:hypothetical protein RF11_01455 [Thelohanellus kitauei]|uniref:Cullin family profile domain-containing protein n=1 Tax=Thelohanellus kitauei TaxID=669202 RepID=A0A0C2J355_THEKT|nr:hypothetical protein RF11_01455 [Thelohanellus kitauei]
MPSTRDSKEPGSVHATIESWLEKVHVDQHIDIGVLRESVRSLCLAIEAILDDQSSSKNYQTLYGSCYFVCIHTSRIFLFHLIKKLIETHLNKFTEKLSVELNGSGAIFLNEIANFWREFRMSVDILNNATLFLSEKSNKKSGICSTKMCARQLLASNLVESPKFESKFEKSLIKLISKVTSFSNPYLNTLTVLSQMLCDVSDQKYRKIFITCTYHVFRSNFELFLMSLKEQNYFLESVLKIDEFIYKTDHVFYRYVTPESFDLIRSSAIQILIDKQFDILKELPKHDVLFLIKNKRFEDLLFLCNFFGQNKTLFDRYFQHFHSKMLEYITFCNSTNAKKINVIIPIPEYLEIIFDFIHFVNHIFKYCFKSKPQIKDNFKKYPKLFVRSHIYFDHYLLQIINDWLMSSESAVLWSISQESQENVDRFSFFIKMRNVTNTFLDRYEEMLLKRLLYDCFSPSKEHRIFKILLKHFGPSQMSVVTQILEDSSQIQLINENYAKFASRFVGSCYFYQHFFVILSCFITSKCQPLFPLWLF